MAATGNVDSLRTPVGSAPSVLLHGPDGISPSPPDFLPSISPSVMYSTAQAMWTPHELQLLHAGLRQFPADRFDNVTRYIKIAATLPGKCVRDVAFKVRELGGSQAMLPAAKRIKVEPYQGGVRGS